MAHLISLDSIIELLLAISLSAAAGFRVFVPFFVLSAAAVFGHIDFPAQLDWAETPQALGLFGLAVGLEVLGYSVPWFDHFLDVVATPAAIIAGTALTGAISPEMDPLVRWTFAITAGGGTAGVTKGLMVLLRGASTAISGGLTNPVFALLEVLAALILSVMAIAVPLVAGTLVMALMGYGVYRLGSFLRQWFTKKPMAEL